MRLTIIRDMGADWCAVYDENGKRVWEGHDSDLEPDTLLTLAQIDFSCHYEPTDSYGFPEAIDLETWNV